MPDKDEKPIVPDDTDNEVGDVDPPVVCHEDLERGVFLNECECCGEKTIVSPCDCRTTGLRAIYLGDGMLALECEACGFPICIVPVAHNPNTMN